jgi:hypothetical protein
MDLIPTIMDKAWLEIIKTTTMILTLILVKPTQAKKSTKLNMILTIINITTSTSIVWKKQ